MNLEIGKYLITTDKLNFILNEKYEKMDKFGHDAKPSGVFAYREVSFHPSVESALRKILTLDLIRENIVDVHSLLEIIQRHQEELEALYSNLSIVVQEVSK